MRSIIINAKAWSTNSLVVTSSYTSRTCSKWCSFIMQQVYPYPNFSQNNTSTLYSIHDLAVNLCKFCQLCLRPIVDLVQDKRNTKSWPLDWVDTKHIPYAERTKISDEFCHFIQMHPNIGHPNKVTNHHYIWYEGQEEKGNPKSFLSSKFCSSSILKLKGSIEFLANSNIRYHHKFWVYHIITLKGKDMALSRQRLSLIGFRGEISSSFKVLKKAMVRHFV